MEKKEECNPFGVAYISAKYALCLNSIMNSKNILDVKKYDGHRMKMAQCTKSHSHLS